MGVSAKKSVRSAKENSALCAPNSAHCALRRASSLVPQTQIIDRVASGGSITGAQEPSLMAIAATR